MERHFLAQNHGTRRHRHDRNEIEEGACHRTGQVLRAIVPHHGAADAAGQHQIEHLAPLPEAELGRELRQGLVCHADHDRGGDQHGDSRDREAAIAGEEGLGGNRIDSPAKAAQEEIEQPERRNGGGPLRRQVRPEEQERSRDGHGDSQQDIAGEPFAKQHGGEDGDHQRFHHGDERPHPCGHEREAGIHEPVVSRHADDAGDQKARPIPERNAPGSEVEEARQIDDAQHDVAHGERVFRGQRQRERAHEDR